MEAACLRQSGAPHHARVSQHPLYWVIYTVCVCIIIIIYIYIYIYIYMYRGILNGCLRHDRRTSPETGAHAEARLGREREREEASITILIHTPIHKPINTHKHV